MASDDSSADWGAIRRELLAMAEEDRRVRAALAADGSLFEGYHPRMRATHDGHAARLALIFDRHGWPGWSRVGADGAEAAWLIVQHAIAQPALQRRALSALLDAAERGEVPPWQPAMLEDRIRVFDGRLQRYGTQLDWNAEGTLAPLPIEDPAGVDRRRRSAGSCWRWRKRTRGFAPRWPRTGRCSMGITRACARLTTTMRLGSP